MIINNTDLSLVRESDAITSGIFSYLLFIIIILIYLYLLLLLSNIAAHFPKEVARGLCLQRQPVNKTLADRRDNVRSRILMGIFQILPLRTLTPMLLLLL